MTSRGRVVLVVVLIVLGISEFSWTWFRAMTQMMDAVEAQFAQTDSEQAEQTSTKLPPGARRSFTDDEVRAFAAKARTAETIPDPLQRCINYPDPPGSHWPAATTEAYCRYRLQWVVSFDEAQAMIRSGHAADLDRRLAQDLQAELTQPQSRGLLDRTYFLTFNGDSFDVRQTLDAWKRASPDSAFALAASGTAYVSMAHKARGGELTSQTSDDSFESMDRLLQQADTDLQRAVQLNPKITPAYVAMMDAGAMSLGREYTDAAFRRGTAAVPDNYALYAMYMHVAEPKWGGSLKAMDTIAQNAQRYAKQNPLMDLLLPDRPGYDYNVCNCSLATAINWDAYPTVFDHVADTELLFAAGHAGNLQGQPKLGVIYLSEGLRFKPDDGEGYVRRGFALTNVGETNWALDEANHEIQREPLSAWGYSMRGYAYKAMHDPTHAAPDLEKATAIEPGNTFPLEQLGWMYVFDSHDWNKGWDIADRLIRDHPDQATGWVLRFNIQKQQPRPGVHDTINYFLEHFGNDPEQAHWASQMRVGLAAESSKTDGVGKATKTP